MKTLFGILLILAIIGLAFSALGTLVDIAAGIMGMFVAIFEAFARLFRPRPNVRAK